MFAASITIFSHAKSSTFQETTSSTSDMLDTQFIRAVPGRYDSGPQKV